MTAQQRSTPSTFNDKFEGGALGAGLMTWYSVFLKERSECNRIGHIAHESTDMVCG